MTGILKVDTIQKNDGSTPTAADLGITVTEGIKHADLWRLNSNISFGAGGEYLLSGWERADDASSGYVGSGINESSGIFTFPETGIWHILYHLTCYTNTTGKYISNVMYVSVDGGSSFDIVATGETQNSTGNYESCSCEAFVKVSDISQTQVKLFGGGNDSGTIRSRTDWNYTYITCIRLGDAA